MKKLSLATIFFATYYVIIFCVLLYAIYSWTSKTLFIKKVLCSAAFFVFIGTFGIFLNFIGTLYLCMQLPLIYVLVCVYFFTHAHSLEAFVLYVISLQKKCDTVCKTAQTDSFISLASLAKLKAYNLLRAVNIEPASFLDLYGLKGSLIIIILSQLLTNYHILVFLLMIGGRYYWLVPFCATLSIFTTAVYFLIQDTEWKKRFELFMGDGSLLCLGMWKSSSILYLPLCMSFAGILIGLSQCFDLIHFFHL